MGMTKNEIISHWEKKFEEKFPHLSYNEKTGEPDIAYYLPDVIKPFLRQTLEEALLDEDDVLYEIGLHERTGFKECRKLARAITAKQMPKIKVNHD